MFENDIIFIRHGEPDCRPNIFLGSTDPSLDDIGRAQIEQSAVALRGHWPDEDEGHHLRRLYCSGLKRAQESADIVSRHFSMPVESDARLNELHFGDWEGRSFAEVGAETPEAVDQWFANPLDNPSPGGESFRDLALRADSFLSDLDDEPCIVVAHFCSIAVMVSRILGTPLLGSDKFALERGQYAWMRDGRLRFWGLPTDLQAKPAEPER